VSFSVGRRSVPDGDDQDQAASVEALPIAGGDGAGVPEEAAASLHDDAKEAAASVHKVAHPVTEEAAASLHEAATKAAEELAQVLSSFPPVEKTEKICKSRLRPINVAAFCYSKAYFRYKCRMLGARNVGPDDPERVRVNEQLKNPTSSGSNGMYFCPDPNKPGDPGLKVFLFDLTKLYHKVRHQAITFVITSPRPEWAASFFGPTKADGVSLDALDRRMGVEEIQTLQALGMSEGSICLGPPGRLIVMMKHRVGSRPPDFGAHARGLFGSAPPRSRVQSFVWISSLAQKIQALHERGYAHLDLKLDNVVVDGDEAHLVDFGSAIDLNSVPLVCGPGTSLYMCLAHVHHLKQGTNIPPTREELISYDWYSFAVIICKMFCDFEQMVNALVVQEEEVVPLKEEERLAGALKDPTKLMFPVNATFFQDVAIYLLNLPSAAEAFDYEEFLRLLDNGLRGGLAATEGENELTEVLTLRGFEVNTEDAESRLENLRKYHHMCLLVDEEF